MWRLCIVCRAVCGGIFMCHVCVYRLVILYV